MLRTESLWNPAFHVQSQTYTEFITELISCYLTLDRMSGRIKLLHLSDRLQHLLVITKDGAPAND